MVVITYCLDRGIKNQKWVSDVGWPKNRSLRKKGMNIIIDEK